MFDSKMILSYKYNQVSYLSLTRCNKVHTKIQNTLGDGKHTKIQKTLGGKVHTKIQKTLGGKTLIKIKK